MGARNLRRAWVAANVRATVHSVKAAIVQRHLIFFQYIWQAFTASGAMHAADFENISEIRGELNPQRQVHRGRSVVCNSKLLVTYSIPKQARSNDVNRAPPQYDLIPHQEIHVGKVRGKQCVVRPYSGTEK